MYTKWWARVFVLCWLAAAALCLHGEASGQTQQAGSPCQPSAPLRQQLNEISNDDDTTVSFVERRERGLTRLRSLLTQFPNDVFVHQAYQDAVLAEAGIDARPLLEQYHSLLALHPREPLYLYLYGRLLIGRETAEAETQMERALRWAPNFPWPHLGLVEVYQTPQFDNKSQRQFHLSAFMRACPRSLRAFAYLRAFDDPVLLRAGAQKLRALLLSGAGGDDVSPYNTLWDLELRGRPAARHGSVRAHIETDLKRIRQFDAPDKKVQLLTLRDGYRQLGNEEQARRLEDEVVKVFPHSETALQLTQARWREAHPPPDEASTSEQQRTYYVALKNADDEWTRQWPHSFALWLDRMSAVSQLGDVPEVEVERTADNVIRASVENAGSFRTTPPVPLLVSELYLKYSLRLARIPDLVRRGLEETEQQAAREAQSEQTSPELAKYALQSRQFTLWRGLVMMADAYLRLKQPQNAVQVLEEMSASLAKHRPDAAAPAGDKGNYAYFQATYWAWQGRVAEAENRKLEAFVYYEQALATRPTQDDKSGSDEWGELPRKLQQLWSELGGTNEGWELWAQRGATNRAGPAAQLAAGGERKEEPLPDFALTDLRGHTWRLANLRGKVVFINIWATWCKPCQQELPLVQQLHDSLKTRTDAVVLTLNIDTDVGLIEPFVKAKGFTFPVLPAYQYVQHFRPDLVLPRSWVVSPAGVLRQEQVGFGREASTWLKRTLDMIQNVGTEQ